MYKAKMIAIDWDDDPRELNSEGITATQAHEQLMNQAGEELGDPSNYKALIIVICHDSGDFTVNCERREVPDVHQN